jgi:FtsH-binding integral membrane protein
MNYNLNTYNYDGGAEINPNYSIAGILLAILIIIGFISSNLKHPFTTKQFITNIYLYIILAILLTALTFVFMEKLKISVDSSSTMYCTWGAAIMAIIIIFAFAITPRENIISTHTYFLIFAIAMGILVYPEYMVSKENNTLLQTLGTVIVIVLLLTWITHQFPPNYFKGWGPILLMGLFGLIVFELLDILFGGDVGLSLRSKIYAAIGVVLFSGFLMYDTSRINDRAIDVVNCVNSGEASVSVCADYPKESINVYLDILNLFVDVSTLQQ